MPVDMKAAEKFATEVLRESLVPDIQTERWTERLAQLVGGKALTRWKAMGGDDTDAMTEIARAAYLLGLAIGQRLRPNALDENT